MSRVAVALVHYPVVDGRGDKVATNVTNFDIHDIARACQAFGIEKYYIVTPMKEQLMFVSRVLDHWRVGYGARYNPMRRTALDPVQTVESLDEAIKDLGGEVSIVATSARDLEKLKKLTFSQLREQIKKDSRDILLVFGTGYGLHEELLAQCHSVLEPIKGVPPKDYRHLSVRSAVSICLDRLLGTW